MKPNLPSLTAQRVAMSRAAHQLLEVPRLFEDPIAVRIIGEQNSRNIISTPERYLKPSASYLRAFLVARSKYTEDALSKAVSQGMRQYVILGAGLDTFPYRNPFESQLLRVFEVDHPATQAWKRECLDAQGIPIPGSLRFVPVDFEKENLEDQIPKAGFNKKEASFFSWLGVTMYLPPESVLTMLKSIAKLAAEGSEVVFDYALSPTLLSRRDLVSYQTRAARVAAAGEPWKSAFNPNQLAAELRTVGFTVLEDLDSAAINARYFEDRTDDFHVAGRAHLLRAALT
ncbi:MAG: class I SAM-dependent methyltransferase [Anaerolineales bacterium]